MAAYHNCGVLQPRGSSSIERPAQPLERDFNRTKRILVPNLTDWTQMGKVLALLAAKYDYEQIRKGRLTNDALMANERRPVGNNGDNSQCARF